MTTIFKIFLLVQFWTFIQVSHTSKIYITSEQNGREVFSAHCEKLGDVSPDISKSYLTNSNPPDACSELTDTINPSTNSGKWILLAFGNKCNVTTKIRNAQIANYSAVIIMEVYSDSFNENDYVDGNHLEPNSAIDEEGFHVSNNKPIIENDWDDIAIFSCVANERDGKILRQKYTYLAGSSRYVAALEDDSTVVYNSHYLFLALVGTTVCMSVVWLLLYCTCRLINNGYIWLRETLTGIPYESIAGRTYGPQNLPKWVLKKLPVKIWSDTDPKDICAICIEEILPSDAVRFLPCSHGFHTTCVDKWLLDSSRYCPICKRKIIYLRKVLTSWNSEQELQYFRNPSSHFLAPIAFNQNCDEESLLCLNLDDSSSGSE